MTEATTPIPADGLPSAQEIYGVKPSGADAARMAAAVADGRIEVPIDRILPLDQAGEAIRAGCVAQCRRPGGARNPRRGRRSSR
jgi:hypothetical protein